VDVSRSAGVVPWEESLELDDTIGVCLCNTSKGGVVLDVEKIISILHDKIIVTYDVLSIVSVTISTGNDASVDARRVC